MTSKSHKQSSLALTQARKALAGARDSGDPRQISLAAANLGLALFDVNKFSEGLQSFYEVDRILTELDDFPLQVHCLGLRTMALQQAEHYPQAFETARRIEMLAIDKKDLGIQVDALATQGQILIDSGEEVFAYEKLSSALKMAEDLADGRRIMNVTGALGNYCLAIASPQKAEAYFEKAVQLARDLDDKQSEIGFRGNLGTLFEWKGEYLQAGKIFEEILAYMRETGNWEAEIQALRHLVQICGKMKDDQQLAKYALDGVAVAKKAGDEHVYYFYELLVTTFSRLNQVEMVHAALAEAVETALKTNNLETALHFMLRLGESYLMVNKLHHALQVFQQAVAAAERVQRLQDKAQVLGRIGVILAELNQVEDAVIYHEQALALAQRLELPDLEGEQLAMLAMAHREQGDVEQARSYGKTAVQVYTKLGLEEQAHRAQLLLAEIEKES